MAVEGDRVQPQHVAHEVDQLAGMTDRVRPLQPQRVLEGPVDVSRVKKLDSSRPE